MGKRVLMCVLGVLVCGISVGMFKRAAFGVDPFQSLMSGLDAVIPVSFGTLYVGANLVLLSFSLMADRRYVGLATIINLSLLGYIAQYTQEFLMTVMPDLSLWGRGVMLAAAVVIMCFASAFYFTADLGVSPYDAVALVITKTWKIGEFRYCRIISDLVCVTAGIGLYLLSGQSISGLKAVVGVGTIVTAFFMGPLIEFFNVHAARPFLEGGKQRLSVKV